ncbi:MAG: RNA polymerase subunit sigma-70 [Deltaproteobacteria bacterium CG11_big_fil_rev_8_21_14_0_20_49_13]|nr:MAG: RNA polymerase subunit sigma-70 [Deltaproteobacteria bacterium CG11_big_fil_rev_8_21_14_0_20_49_13]
MAKSALKMKKERITASDIARKRLLAARKAVATKFAKKKEIEALHKRDMIIEQYMPYATSIANRVVKSLSLTAEYEDILCAARLGLLEAAKRYDDREDVDFRTFAYYRIKGAIYDGLRKSGWIPRSVYSRLKFEEASNEYLQHVSENRAQSSEGKSGKEIFDTVNTLASIYVISLDANEDMDIEDTNLEDLDKRAEYHQIRNHMRDAMGSLPPKEKQLIMMYYFQNKTLEEAGEKLGLSKSWVSRMHARALELLLKRIRILAVKGQTGQLTEELLGE